MTHTYKDLFVWQKAKSLAVEVYRATESFPHSELFGLTGQMRRAAVSVASNIAEGQGRGSKRDFANFICIARGSALELETQLEIAIELGLGNPQKLGELRTECHQITGLLNRLRSGIEAKVQV